MGAGVAHAELSFTNSKCKPLTLGLSQGSSGLATKTGPSVLPLDQTVAAAATPIRSAVPAAASP